MRVADDRSRSVSDRLAELQNLDTPALRERWTTAFGRPAPKRISRDLLLRALAYQMQEQLEGGLSKTARKRLTRAAESTDYRAAATRLPVSRPSPGTRLVREWRGKPHHVTVVEDGFEYRGERYGSLSQIARAITGTRWSGPLFFGLRKPASCRASRPHSKS